MYGLLDRCNACGGHLRVLWRRGISNVGFKFVLAGDEVRDDSGIRVRGPTACRAEVAKVEQVVPKVAKQHVMVALTTAFERIGTLATVERVITGALSVEVIIAKVAVENIVSVAAI